MRQVMEYDGASLAVMTAAPRGFQSGDRITWFVLFQNVSGFFVHPVGLEVLVDHSSLDISQWAVNRVFYNGQYYRDMVQLESAYVQGRISVEKVRKAPQDGDFSSMKPRAPLAALFPLQYEPQGPRYSVRNNLVLFQAWSFAFGMSVSTGLRLFDIRHKGERVAYEISVQEALSVYGSNCPGGMSTRYMDGSFGLGHYTSPLVRGVDCPYLATYLDVHYLAHSQVSRITRNALCIFEQNLGSPLRRHYSNLQSLYYGGLVNSALVVRSIATVGNYDYVWDFIFYQNGAIEGKVQATGYPSSSFLHGDGLRYGNRLWEHTLGTIHTHFINYKVDLDVGDAACPWLRSIQQVLPVLTRELPLVCLQPEPSWSFWVSSLRAGRDLEATENGDRKNWHVEVLESQQVLGCSSVDWPFRGVGLVWGHLGAEGPGWLSQCPQHCHPPTGDGEEASWEMLEEAKALRADKTGALCGVTLQREKPISSLSGDRITWFVLFQNVSGFFVHPVGLEVLVDHSSLDISQWAVNRVFYNGQYYRDMVQLESAYVQGRISVEKVRKAPQDGDFSSMKPRAPLAALFPLQYEPQGPRYSVRNNLVLFQAWSFAFGMSVSTGLRLFDIRHKGERVAYEISVQEALSVYGSNCPGGMSTRYMDGSFGLGHYTSPLVRGVDCPYLATYLDVHYLAHSQVSRITRNALCIFEQNLGSPLRRHYSNLQSLYYGGLVNSALVVRSIATVGNYDYVWDFIFYQIFLSTWVKNSLVAHDMAFEMARAPWSPEQQIERPRLTKKVLDTEDQAAFRLQSKMPRYIYFAANSKNKWGHQRGYRIQITSFAGDHIPEASSMERAISWARYQLAVTRRKEEEPTSTSIYNQNDPWTPTVAFTDFINNETITNEKYGGKVPYHRRPVTGKEYMDINALIQRELKKAPSFLAACCESDGTDLAILTTAPRGFKSGDRTTWFVLFHNMAGTGYYLSPVGLEVLVEHKDLHVSNWQLHKVFYNGRYFATTGDLEQEFVAGTLEVVKLKQPQADAVLGSMKLRSPPDSPGPLHFEAQGPRYRVRDNHITFQGWSIAFGMNPNSGPRLFDIRYRGERIVYELSLQEALALYGSNCPGGMSTRYLDGSFGIGRFAYELVRGLDCPYTATYVDRHYLAESDAPKTNQNSLCIFEHDSALPLRRHFSDSQSFYYGGLRKNTLVIRTISTLINYDYIWDFMFHGSGAVEVRVHATGYISTSFLHRRGTDYGNRVGPHTLGTMHLHHMHYKVDLDVDGQLNSLETQDMEYELIKDPWSMQNTIERPYLRRKSLEREDEAAFPLDAPMPRYLSFASPNPNKWGHPRSYRIQTVSFAGKHLPTSSSMERSVSWGRYQLAVTRRKEEEPTSTSIYNQNDPWTPTVAFADFINNETITSEDLVAWISVGFLHVPHAEDVPNTVTVGNGVGFFLRPYNYFDEDPSVDSPDSVYFSSEQDAGACRANPLACLPRTAGCAPRLPPFRFGGFLNLSLPPPPEGP
ncbi:hypothetical protein WISP_44862 [Willisornis vidua]|uniref:Amine oxidase n=1 Tax=Willisornis vidua TaxID=1566151 RepID=A0ABQ9DKC3_9PASS|nr:hypothetical protein WISP_44862 [Willisornis vidua]